MPDVLIVADTVRSPDLRHEVPLAVPDPFLYAEVGGKRSVVVSSLEASRIEELGTGLAVLTYEDAGVDELLKRGLDVYAHELELHLAACRLLGLDRAVTPAGFPWATPTICARRASSSPSTSSSSTSAGA